MTYHANVGLGPLSIGRWFGASHKVGQLMSHWVLTISGQVVSCTNVQRLINAEENADEWKKRMQEYDAEIAE